MGWEWKGQYALMTEFRFLIFSVISKCGFTNYHKNTLMVLRDWTLWPALKQVCSSLLISWCIFPADLPPRVLNGMGAINH